MTRNQRLSIANDKLIFSLLKQGIFTVDLEVGDVFAKNVIGGGYRKIGLLRKDGYITACIQVNGRSKHFNIHRIILIAKSGGPLPHGSLTDHINRVRSDNRASNLRIVSAFDSNKNRMSQKGEANPNARITAETVKKMRIYHKQSNSVLQTAAEFSVSRTQTTRILNGECWK